MQSSLISNLGFYSFPFVTMVTFHTTSVAVEEVVSVFIQKTAGQHIIQLVDSGVDVFMNISVGYITIYEERSDPNVMRTSGDGRGGTRNTPVLVVSLLIIVVLIAGLIILLIYGIRRSKRRQQARERNSSHCCSSNGRPSAPRHVVSLRIRHFKFY